MSGRLDVVALYVDPLGPYPKLVHECWDESRDARFYNGPLPIVAHPPCGAWGKLRHLHKLDDWDCALRAVDQVQAFGGILEHPAGSRLWAARHLPEPYDMVAPGDGFTIQVDQVQWGHVARKKTWLYIVGVPFDQVALAMCCGHRDRLAKPTHWVTGNRRALTGGAIPDGIKICSSQQRRRTPVPFAEFLLDVASKARRP